MLSLKKIMAMAIIATFLAAIPLAVSVSYQASASVTYSIEVDDYNAKPGGTPGGGKPSGGNKPPSGYSLTGYKWATLGLTLVVNPTDSELLESFVFSTVSASSEVWDSSTGAELVSIYEVDYTASLDGETADGINEVVFGNLGDNRIIAQCTYWYNPWTRELLDFDIAFNTQFTWGDATSNPSLMDLQSIATHELGHGFGLADLYQRKNSELTMYGYAGIGETKKRSLESGDVAGIQALYGS